MATDLHLIAFLLANLFVLVLGVTLMAVSYGAYRRRNRAPLRLAVVGFGPVTLGAILEAVYSHHGRSPRACLLAAPILIRYTAALSRFSLRAKTLRR